MFLPYLKYGYGLLSIHLTPKEVSGHTQAAGTDISLYLLSFLLNWNLYHTAIVLSLLRFYWTEAFY